MNGFRASECLVGPLGILVVGSREPGTRIVASTIAGFVELALPFEPPRGLPVAWLTGSRFVAVGRDGSYLIASLSGTTAHVERRAITAPSVIRGVTGRFAYAAGPQFFVLRDDHFVDDGPMTAAAEAADDLDFSAPTHRTKMVDAFADGATPIAFGAGAHWYRTGDVAWIEAPGPSVRIAAVATAPDGAVVAAGAKGTLLLAAGGTLAPISHDLGGVAFTAVAALGDSLLLGTTEGLWQLRHGATTKLALPGDGTIDAISVLGDVAAVVRGGHVWVRHGATTWQQLVIPDPK